MPAMAHVEQLLSKIDLWHMIHHLQVSDVIFGAEDMLPAVYLTCGKIAPEYENLELNVGGSTVAAAIVEATGAQRSRLREMYKDHGDLGDVAQACRHTQALSALPLHDHAGELLWPQQL